MKKIAVIGDLMLDQYDVCKHKYYCEEENNILDFDHSVYRAGGAANTAINIKNIINNEVYIFGSVGNDTSGQRLINIFNDTNINYENIFYSKKGTTIKRRLIANNQIQCRVDHEYSVEGFENFFLNKVLSKLTEMDAIVISDYDKGIISSSIAREIINQCRNSLIFVDTKKENVYCFNGIHTLCITLAEFNKISNKSFESLRYIDEYGFDFANRNNMINIIIKNNAEGSLLYDCPMRKKYYTRNYAEKKCAIGAGDVFISVFCSYILNNASTQHSLTIANEYATKSITELYTSIIERQW